MLSTVATKTFLDRWKGVLIGALTLAVLFFAGMAVYRDIDLDVYTQLPEALRALMNLPVDADVGALAYGGILSSYGALTLAGLGISMGAASIAGEERDGTLGLLLGNPRSRTDIVVSKAITMVALLAIGAALLWVAGVVVPRLLDVDSTGIQVGALVLHIFVIAVFSGFLALAVGAWTGRATLASGLSAGVVAVSFVAVGLLPLVDALASGAKLFPWYYYASSNPQINGIDWGHLTVLLAGTAVLAVVAVVGVNRRDLRGQTSRTGVLTRLRSTPLFTNVTQRLAGSARISRISAKALTEDRGIVSVVALVMFFMMGLAIGPIYNSIDRALLELTDAFPAELLAMFGGGDMSTPEGFYQIETFGLMAPIAFMVVTIRIGARALAGEEAAGTMGLLLANPVKRSTVVLEKTAAMVVHAIVIALATFAGVVGGSALGGLGMSSVNIAATTLLAMLIGLVFGALALAFGAVTGRTRVARSEL